MTQDVQWIKKFYGSQKGKKASKVYLELNIFDNEPEQEPEENLEEEIEFKSDNNEEDILKELSQIHEEEAKEENITPIQMSRELKRLQQSREIGTGRTSLILFSSDGRREKTHEL